MCILTVKKLKYRGWLSELSETTNYLFLPNIFPFQMTSSIVFRRMYGWYYPGYSWDTYSTVNKRTYFCCEEDCTKEAHVPDGRCDMCHDRMMERLQYEHNPPHCTVCTGRMEGEFYDGVCEDCYFETQEPHKCSGEFDYENGTYVCDDRDDSCCPQHPQQHPSVPKSCADCGSVPKCGVFHFYRGNDPLCKSCEEENYGPPTPDYGYDDVHYPCVGCSNYYTKKYIFTPNPGRCNTCLAADAKEELEECPGCGNSIYAGLRANGYCGICWEERFA